MSILFARKVERGNGRRRASFGRNAMKRHAATRRPATRENYYAVLVPGTGPAVECVAKTRGRTACHFNLHQFPVGEECNKLPVRGPERVVSAVGSGKGLCRHRIEAANPKGLFTIRHYD